MRCSEGEGEQSVKIGFTLGEWRGKRNLLPATEGWGRPGWLRRPPHPTPPHPGPAASGAFVMYTERRRVSLTVLEDFTSSTEGRGGESGESSGYKDDDGTFGSLDVSEAASPRGSVQTPPS